MRLYVDDDSVDPGLIRLLRRDGHDVQVPADVGLAGSSDQVHLAHAIRDLRAILTRNHRDFDGLHDLVVRCERPSRKHLGGSIRQQSAEHHDERRVPRTSRDVLAARRLYSGATLRSSRVRR